MLLIEVHVAHISLQVDVIVNSISPTLHLSGRKLSSALGASAGPGLQRALQALPERPKVGDVLVTPGFGLRSKYVYHVVATGYYTAGSESVSMRPQKRPTLH